MKRNLFPVFSLLLLLNSCGGDHKVEVSPDYDKHQMPWGARPIKINASLNLRNIIEISEPKQAISIKLTLRLFWKDDRVKLIKDNESTHDLPRDNAHNNMSYLVQNREEIDKYWLPDLFVDQAIQTRNPSYKIPIP